MWSDQRLPCMPNNRIRGAYADCLSAYLRNPLLIWSIIALGVIIDGYPASCTSRMWTIAVESKCKLPRAASAIDLKVAKHNRRPSSRYIGITGAGNNLSSYQKIADLANSDTVHSPWNITAATGSLARTGPGKGVIDNERPYSTLVGLNKIEIHCLQIKQEDRSKSKRIAVKKPEEIRKTREITRELSFRHWIGSCH
ncbi:hypothetical protein K435DRAFT_810198 [Dendrothele bispora CBS 962.96]|uniref:Uncharacterized protein n=1 Tax=Dendrothele bispora (strain CBS 962.96) TaxID=1314807 RepID=A0A4S8KVT2_DENBC|nr:hypothetical protein K435DRAFT_810198 [Dendrothele bispora CBS 962.96]